MSSIKTDLILFEGMPGSGKSALSQWLWLTLLHNGVKADWYWEMDARFPRRPETGGDPDWLEWWHRTVAQNSACGELLLMDAALFQKAMLHGMQRNRDIGCLTEEVAEIEGWLAQLSPVLVQLKVPDPLRHMERLLEDRGSRFSRNLVQWVEGTGYARSRGLTGPSGCCRFWEDYQDLCLGLFEKWGGRKLLLEGGCEKMSGNREKLAALCALADRSGAGHNPEPEEDIAGTYRLVPKNADEAVRCCVIRPEPQGWLAEGLAQPLEERSYLMPDGLGGYLVRGQNTRLVPGEPGNDGCSGFHVASAWARLDGARLLRCA